ncbi:MAG: PRC-barrel domain-containing protein [Sulfitobacter sp.]
MKRFLSTTAVLVALSGSAYAEAHSGAFGSVMSEETDFFASDLIGMRIYNSETEMDVNARVPDGAETEWDDIGEINDIIIGQNGEVRAVILGVGGFLGMGERDVSVSMDAIKVVREEGDSDDRFLVVTTSKEMLEQAPEFDRGMDDGTDEAMENTNATTGQTMENADTTTGEAVENAETTNDEAMENAEANTGVIGAESPRQMLTRPAVTREGYTDVDWNEMTADDLEGARIYGTADEDIGEIEELIVSNDGKITHVLADIGGFLGMGEHTVQLSFEELQLVRNDNGADVRIYVDSTQEKLEQLPEYNG